MVGKVILVHTTWNDDKANERVEWNESQQTQNHTKDLTIKSD